MSRSSFLPALITVLLAAAASAAQPLTARQDDYQLSERDGPYMILVASFVGDEAEALAKRLTEELRQDYKLQAYWFSKSERERAERDRMLEEWKRLHNNAPAKKHRIVDEYCVLVGHYKTMEAASKELERIKKLKPPKSVPTGPGLFIATPEFRKNVSNWLDGGKIRQAGVVSQFSRAFVVRNPLLPGEKPQAINLSELSEEDKLIAHLNATDPFTLVKAKGKWTLLVSVHGGQPAGPSTKPSIFDRLNPWSSETGPILRSGSNPVQEARELAQLLRDRKFGFDAYILHSHGTSFVTVGDFEGPNDPELARVQKQLAGMKVGNFQLMANPLPMPIPRADN
ncbi:MAG: hypothetical protein NZM31_14450 [Gemmatales bacterium]|nr:hypothetical protein [Gemmatales bacterium]MDW8388196.1 hypothetical protein [Gemmatales bacterium]